MTSPQNPVRQKTRPMYRALFKLTGIIDSVRELYQEARQEYEMEKATGRSTGAIHQPAAHQPALHQDAPHPPAAHPPAAHQPTPVTVTPDTVTPDTVTPDTVTPAPTIVTSHPENGAEGILTTDASTTPAIEESQPGKPSRTTRKPASGSGAVGKRQGRYPAAVPPSGSRDTTCARCGSTFHAPSHREKFCAPCRPEARRERQQAWKEKQKTKS